MSKILLLGGTGALGSYLVKELQRSDHDVLVTSRSRHNDHGNIRYVRGNAKNPAFLERLLRNRFDCIVDFMIWPTHSFRENYERLATSTGHYVYLSSYRVYADGGMTPLNEDAPQLVDVTNDVAYLRSDEYALAKGREERVLRTSRYRNYTILRPSITFSQKRFQLGTLEAETIIPRSLQGKPLLLPKEMLDKRAAVSWAGDVGRMMACVLGNPRAMGEAFNVGSSESHDWKTIAGYYHELIGTEIVPTSMKVYLKVVPGKYQVMYDRMFNRRLDNAKILRLMGAAPSDLTPIKDALALELADPVRVGASIREDRKCSRNMDRQLLLHHPLQKLHYDIKRLASGRRRHA